MDTKRIVSVGIRQTGIEGDKVVKALGAEEATHGPSFLLPPPVVLTIDREYAFIFIGSMEFTYMDINPRSLELRELDVTKVRLVTTLQSGEAFVDHKTNSERLDAKGYIMLDVDMFDAFRRNPKFIPESWKEKKNGKIQYIHFDGTILQYGYFPPKYGVACLSWSNNSWNECVDFYYNEKRINTPSAVLEV